MNTDFGKILKIYRERERISQTELAKRLDISRTYVSQLECNVSKNVSWRLGCKIIDLCALSDVVTSSGVFLDLQEFVSAELVSGRALPEA